jgi:hypothetical protein
MGKFICKIVNILTVAEGKSKCFYANGTSKAAMSLPKPAL